MYDAPFGLVLISLSAVTYFKVLIRFYPSLYLSSWPSFPVSWFIKRVDVGLFLIIFRRDHNILNKFQLPQDGSFHQKPLLH